MVDILVYSDNLEFHLTSVATVDKILEMERHASPFVFQWNKDTHLNAINSNEWIHITIKNRKNTIIGYLLLNMFKFDDGIVDLTRIVIDEKGHGYGKESVELVKKYSFEILKCNRLSLDVFTNNHIAIRLYDSLDFVKEGTLRQCKKIHNEYFSMHLYSILKEEYFSHRIASNL